MTKFLSAFFAFMKDQIQNRHKKEMVTRVDHIVVELYEQTDRLEKSGYVQEAQEIRDTLLKIRDKNLDDPDGVLEAVRKLYE